MIATSTKPVLWDQTWDKDLKIWFRPGDVFDRGEFEAELETKYRAGRVIDFQLRDAFEIGLRAIFEKSPEDADQIMEWYDAQGEWEAEQRRIKAAAKQAGEGEKPKAGKGKAAKSAGPKHPLSPTDQAALEQARETVADNWPPYNSLIGRLARRREIAPTLAFQWFCTGWEGPNLPTFEKGPDGRVLTPLLGKIDPLTRQLAGLFALSLLYVGEEERKNS